MIDFFRFTAPQARAGRALLGLSREEFAAWLSLPLWVLEAAETGNLSPQEEGAHAALSHAFKGADVVPIPAIAGGVGVRFAGLPRLRPMPKTKRGRYE